jgi:hypothetical protein
MQEDKDKLIQLLCQQMIGLYELTQISRHKNKAASETRYQDALKFQEQERALAKKIPTIEEVKALYNKIYKKDAVTSNS